MKKKLFAGLLCLLMVFTMIPGVFAASTESAADVYSNIYPGVSIIENCPECKYDTAFFYIINENVIYFCPSCKASGPLFENTRTCICGSDCHCMIQCDCGRYVMCGDMCRSCYRYNVCDNTCFDCWYGNGSTNNGKCLCGTECQCLILCDCNRFVYCGMKCPGCSRYNYCEKDCADCKAPKCACGCGEECNVPVECDCGNYVFCGDFCWDCRKYVYCDNTCALCPPHNNYPSYPDYFYSCICGNDCFCPVKCDTCGKVGFCDSFCDTCDKYLSCGPYCSNCWYWGSSSSANCICGSDCLCLVPCKTCLKLDAGFCGEKCSTCGNTLKCFYNCKTCSYVAPTVNKVTVTQSYGGTYDITNGYYGTNNETKTLTVKAYPGYIVSDVTINGVSHGDTTEFELKMDRSYQISISFARLGFVRQYTVTTNITGGGSVVVTKNGTSINETAVVSAAHKDTLYYTFVSGENYYVKDVKINGESIGAVSLYAINEITKDTTIDVVFGWKNPYTDIEAKHLAAVEYATEKKLMSNFYTYRLKHLFKGEKNVSLINFVTTLAEAQDVKNALNTLDDRFNWAVAKGIIAEDANISSNVTPAVACELIAKFLSVVEKDYNLTFNGKTAEASAKDLCLALKLTTEEVLTANKNLKRYDLAELLLSLSKVTYTK